MLTIGLLNNMAENAFYSAERRFIRVLGAAARGIPIRLHYYATQYLPNDGTHRPLKALWDDALDGLLVTGAEPSKVPIKQEPLWNDLTRVAIWAADNTTSAIWSCLSGHIAAHFVDGIERVRHPRKIFGVYESLPHTRHALLSGIHGRWNVPHSRWNDLLEEMLRAKGYTILCSARSAGVDRCVKTVGRSEFVLLQTHPEYGTSTLLREYQRDVERYRDGIILQPPLLPSGILDSVDAASLEAWCLDATPRHSTEIYSRFSQISVDNTWTPSAAQFFHNWLVQLASAKSSSSIATNGFAVAAVASPP